MTVQYILENKETIKFLVAFSGGKDSVAMVLHLLELGVPESNIVLHHHEVDGHGEDLFDWNCTTSYCKAFAQAMDLPILFSYREGGILREMQRTNEGLQDVLFQKEVDGEFIRLKSRKGSSTRRKFPAVAASLMTRWCSSVVKIDVLSRVVANNPEYAEGDFVVCTGERREESSNRAKYQELEKYRAFNKKRNVFQWRPIIDFTEKQVWDLIEDWTIQCHPCYELGWGRASCQTCIFSSANIWATINELAPEKVDRIEELEDDFQHTLYNKVTIREKVNKGTSFMTPELRSKWAGVAQGEFNLPIFVTGKWTLPKGAFQHESAGSV